MVHRPDLPPYDNAAKVGFGLWNLPLIALALEAALLFGGMWLYLSATAWTALAAYAVFAAVMARLEQPRRPVALGPASGA